MPGCWGDSGDAARAMCWAVVTGWSHRAHMAPCQRAAWPVASGGVSGLGTSPKGVDVVGQTHYNGPFHGSYHASRLWGASSTQNAAAPGLSPTQLSS